MSRPAIQVEGISKLYRLGMERSGQYRTLRESVERAATTALRRVSRRAEPDPSAAKGGDFWALRDVSFDVEPGEVVGILGRNGAGKSTLLKLLSRIVEPTAGRATIRGRVGSLLEVGTGFHPELTGRENIYLNGSILGMSRHDIARQFDAIVDFAEVEAFLDTPVKRYSSGMYVRLAFAVAAHLDLDILIVDEVLAVGDIQFQKKCLGKMHSITSSGGKTVLFVSHNTNAIQALCTSTVVLEHGRVVLRGDVSEGLNSYLGQMRLGAVTDMHNRSDRRGTGRGRFCTLRVLDPSDRPVPGVGMGEPFSLELDVNCSSPIRQPVVAVAVWTTGGQRIFRLMTRDVRARLPTAEGRFTVRCSVDAMPLNFGSYSVSLYLYDGTHELVDEIHEATVLEVVQRDVFGSGQIPKGNNDLIFVHSSWRLDNIAGPV